MALTDKQVYDLNNMNRAAQNVLLGDLLKESSGDGNEYVLPAASKDSLGGVKQCDAVAEATGESVTKEEFKALLDALKAAGVMADN